MVFKYAKNLHMRPKKNPNKDLNIKRGFYFVLALLAILALIYVALEWKSLQDNKGYDLGNLPNKEISKKNATIVLKTKASN